MQELTKEDQEEARARHIAQAEAHADADRGANRRARRLRKVRLVFLRQPLRCVGVLQHAIVDTTCRPITLGISWQALLRKLAHSQIRYAPHLTSKSCSC